MVEQVKEIKPEDVKWVNETQVCGQFLKDATRMEIYLTSPGHKPENITPKPEGRTGQEVYREIEEHAVQKLNDFIDRLGIPTSRKVVAIKNLTSLMDQGLGNIIMMSSDNKCFNEMGFVGKNTGGAEQTNSQKIELSQVDHGLQINFQLNAKVETIPPHHIGGNHKVKIDPNRNSYQIELQLHVGLDEVVQETMKVDIQKASYQLNLDFDG